MRLHFNSQRQRYGIVCNGNKLREGERQSSLPFLSLFCAWAPFSPFPRTTPLFRAFSSLRFFACASRTLVSFRWLAQFVAVGVAREELNYCLKNIGVVLIPPRSISLVCESSNANDYEPSFFIKLLHCLLDLIHPLICITHSARKSTDRKIYICKRRDGFLDFFFWLFCR